MMKNTLLLTFALTALGFTDIQYVNAAEEDCVQAESETGQAKRRRPGQTKDCEPSKKTVVNNADSERVKSRRRPSTISDNAGITMRSSRQRMPNAVSPVPRPKLQDYVASEPMPDRWRVADALGYKDKWYDPYNRNVLKADKPLYDDWFFSLGIISDSFYEKRDVVTPVGVATANRAGSNDVFGSSDQNFFNQNLALEFIYFKGDTVFRPPDYEFRFTPVFNYNYLNVEEVGVVNANAARGTTRDDDKIGIQAAFVDIHIRNVSDRYDFDSIRFGIQPFSTDFRGFLFQDSQLGIRLFGTRDNNIFQYNIALFQRLEKDANSGLNAVSESIRDDYIFAANVYWQDLFVKGFISQATIVHNKNGEDDPGLFFNKNNFIERPASFGRETPRKYDVTYIGYNGDGHFGRYNLTTSLYYAFGENEPGVFVNQPTDIEAAFFAAELSIDYDWIRPRISFLYGTGDDDPFDDTETGFDAIFENPQIAGSDTSYWFRQNVPLVGGGRVAISSRNGLLNSLRSSKELGQSNFTNPGLILFGVGVDVDVLPELRVSANVNQLFFAETEVLEVARNQGDIDEDIGQDVSLSVTYRPLMSQNIVARAAYARLIPGQGYDDLFIDDDADYFMFNLLLAY